MGLSRSMLFQTTVEVKFWAGVSIMGTEEVEVEKTS